MAGKATPLDQVRQYVLLRTAGSSRKEAAGCLSLSDYRSNLIEFTYFKSEVKPAKARKLTSLYSSFRASGLSKTEYARVNHAAVATLNLAAALVRERGVGKILKLIYGPEPRISISIFIVLSAESVCPARRGGGCRIRAPPSSVIAALEHSCAMTIPENNNQQLGTVPPG